MQLSHSLRAPRLSSALSDGRLIRKCRGGVFRVVITQREELILSIFLTQSFIQLQISRRVARLARTLKGSRSARTYRLTRHSRYFFNSFQDKITSDNNLYVRPLRASSPPNTPLVAVRVVLPLLVRGRERSGAYFHHQTVVNLSGVHALFGFQNLAN